MTLPLPWDVVKDVRWNPFVRWVADRILALEAGGGETRGAVKLFDGQGFTRGGRFPNWEALAGAPTDDDYDVILVSSEAGNAENSTFVLGADLRGAGRAAAGSRVGGQGVHLNTAFGAGRMALTNDGEFLLGENPGTEGTADVRMVGLKL